MRKLVPALLFLLSASAVHATPHNFYTGAFAHPLAQTTPAHSVTINLAGSDTYTVFRCTYNTAAPCVQLAAGVTATYTDTTVAAGATYYYWFLDTKQNTPDGYLVVTVSQVTTLALPSTNITTATVQ